MTDRSSTTIKSRHIATLNVKIGAQLQVGSVPVGIRLAIPITGGSVEGPILQGEVLPGGFDYPYHRADGFSFVEARYLLELTDGTILHVTNKGPVTTEPDLSGLTRPTIEAPAGDWNWLNTAILVGTIRSWTENDNPIGVTLEFHELFLQEQFR